MTEQRITQAVILSAGLGTRLRSVTGDAMPKVMVPLCGKPLLEWHIEQFKKHGVREFFINLHYLPEAIRDYCGDGSRWGVNITYALEKPEICGTAGGVKQFEKKLNDAFFVMYGDMVSLVDYTKMARTFHALSPKALGMMIVGRNDHPHDSDLVEVSEDLRFLKIYVKPHQYRTLPSHFRTLDAGYIFRKGILRLVPSEKYYEIDHELLPALLERGEQFYGYETNDFIKDIGTPERYHEVEEYLKGK